MLTHPQNGNSQTVHHLLSPPSLNPLLPHFLTASHSFHNGRHTTPEPPRPNPPQPIHPNPHNAILLLRHLHLLHSLPFLDQSRLRRHSIHILAETPYHTDSGWPDRGRGI